MELQEFNKMCGDIQKEQTELFNKAKKMFENGVYDIGSYKCIGLDVHHSVFSRHEKYTEDLNDADVDYLIEELLKIKEIHKETMGISKTDIEQYAITYDDYLEEFTYRFSYFLLDESKLEGFIKGKTKEKIAELLKPESERYAKQVDCAMLQLYKDGKIDWDTLRTITYKDCDL